jgi:tight adherence protein B
LRAADAALGAVFPLATGVKAQGASGVVVGGRPDPGVLVAAAIGAGLAAALVLLVAGLHGTVVDPTRPPTRTARLLAGARSPQMTGRLIGAALLAALTLAVTRWPVAAAGVGVLVVAWPRLFGAVRTERAQIAQLEALVSWTEALRDTIAAHASLEQAIPATTENAPAAIRPALVRLTGRIRARAPLDKALYALATELDDASSDRVIAALILNVRRRGDSLGEVLTGLATTAREELDLRRRVSAGRAGMRRAVQIVVLLTLLLAAFLILFGGAYLEPYSTPAGQLALAVVIGMFAGGFAWMQQLSGLRPAPAFLQRPGAQLQGRDLAVVSVLTGISSDRAQQLSAQSAAQPATQPATQPSARSSTRSTAQPGAGGELR